MFKPKLPPSLFVLVIMVAIGPFGDTEYTPSLAAIAHHFHVDYAMVQLTMTSYLLSFSICQLFYGPLSDRFGRRPCMLIGSIIFVIGSILCMLCASVPMLIAGRFIQAIGSCAGSVLATAAVRDVYTHPRKRASVYAKINAAFALGPALGPIVGSFVDHSLGWRFNFLILVVLAIFQLIMVYFALPETNQHAGEYKLTLKKLEVDYWKCLTDKHFVPYLMMLGFGIGIVYVSLLGAPDIVINLLHLGSKYIAIIAIGVLSAFIIGSLIASLLSKSMKGSQIIWVGLIVTLISALSDGFLSWNGLVSQHLSASLLPIMGLFMGIAIFYPTVNARALSPFEESAGSASALLGFIAVGIAGLSTGTMSLIYVTVIATLPEMFIGLSILAILTFFFLIVCRPKQKI